MIKLPINGEWGEGWAVRLLVGQGAGNTRNNMVTAQPVKSKNDLNGPTSTLLHIFKLGNKEYVVIFFLYIFEFTVTSARMFYCKKNSASSFCFLAKENPFHLIFCLSAKCSFFIE